MSVVAVYNLKGGVGKTTTAVNLSYLSAAAGGRTLLWDLDPQGASSFAFRIRPRVAGFSRKSLESGHVLAAAIKGTDYDGLDLLPADFAYRKLDRLLGGFGKPQRVLVRLLDALGRDYDTVFLDCPPGFSLLTEGVFAASDLVLVPTIPTVLSLRTLARLIKWLDRCDLTPVLTAFLSMVDRRKALHRRACDWAGRHPEVFLAGQIPYAAVVEQMTVRRMPLPAFAAGDPAEGAFRAIWAEIQTRLHSTGQQSTPAPGTLLPVLRAIEAVIAGLESADGSDMTASRRRFLLDGRDGPAPHPRSDISLAFTDIEGEDGAASVDSSKSVQSDVQFVHSFDTDCRDLQRCFCVLELRERSGSFVLMAARSDGDRDEGSSDTGTWVEAQVDCRWATQILSGGLSPLAALERRLGQPTPWLVGELRAAAGDRALRRFSSHQRGNPPASSDRIDSPGDQRPASPDSANGPSPFLVKGAASVRRASGVHA